MERKELREQLERQADLARASISKHANLVLNPEKNTRLGVVLSSLSTDHVYIGMDAYFVDSDLKAMKQEFSLASMLALASSREDGGEPLQSWSPILYALLSDNEQTVAAIAHLESPGLS